MGLSRKERGLYRSCLRLIHVLAFRKAVITSTREEAREGVPVRSRDWGVSTVSLAVCGRSPLCCVFHAWFVSITERDDRRASLSFEIKALSPVGTAIYTRTCRPVLYLDSAWCLCDLPLRWQAPQPVKHLTASQHVRVPSLFSGVINYPLNCHRSIIRSPRLTAPIRNKSTVTTL